MDKQTLIRAALVSVVALGSVAQIAAAETAVGEAAVDEMCIRQHGLPEFRAVERDVSNLEPVRRLRPHDRRADQRVAQRTGGDAGVEALLGNRRAVGLRHVAGFEAEAS